MKPLATRTQRIGGKGAFGVWERAVALEAQGVKIIHLVLGEPDFPTPPHIVEAAHQAMQAGRTHYASSSGDMALREAIANYLAGSRVGTFNPTDILITPGVKGTLYFSLLALVDHGDEVLVPSPFFPPYASVIQFAGGTPVVCPLYESNGFQLDPADLAARITPQTKAIILNSPGNPTGAIFSQETLAAVADLAQTHDLWVLSDEVYHQLYYTETPPPSIYTLPGMSDRTILMDGFSKAYAMTGWRLGFGVFPEILHTPISTMMVSDHACIPLFIQDAGTAALTSKQDCIDTMRAAYRQRRDRALAVIETMPKVHCVVPDGAFYILLNITETGYEAEAFAYRLLEAGVALLPVGTDHLRLAFTRPEAEIVEGLERMAAIIN
ncbi:MAG: pyridoxal phosphate-dependent aminotransferase [Chloroflexota bacterium]